MSRAFAVIAGLSLLCGCRTGPSQTVRGPSDPDSTILGAWQIGICPTTCTPSDSDAMVATAQIVLTPFTWDAEQPSQPADSVNPSAIPLHPVNGCFEVTRRSDEGAEYVGITPRGSFNWTRDSSGVIHFTLYRSPDAGYGVRAVFRKGSVVGEGGSWGFRAGERGPREMIVGGRSSTDPFMLCH